MPYPSLYISGNLIAQELIDKLDNDDYPGQHPSDFGLEAGTRVRHEIARAWTDANDYWRIFKRKRNALKDTERGTTETRNQWMIPLLSLLGYDLNFKPQPEIIHEKSYDISHRAANRDELPVMIVSAKDELDKKPEGASRYRMSPHALVQEYLNVTEHTYGLVTNGRVLRLLRDNGRITRLTYLEFNLEKIFEEDLYADFALLYRLLHVSRMPQSRAQVANSIIETYYQQAIDAGTRIRNNLSQAVENAIQLLANGLLQHPANEALRQQLQSGEMSALDFYRAQLRLVYRLLFVMTIEERKLVYPEELTPTQQRLSDVYYKYYSLHHLRRLAGRRHLVQPRRHQLYRRLWHNFYLYEHPRYAQQLGMQALASGLFEPGTLHPLDSCNMYNEHLLQALYHLSYFTDAQSGQTIRVNYAALNVEEFGSVYEGLLEYTAQVTCNNGQWQFILVPSDERSKSGSHYTHEDLVQPLIKHSLEYLIEACLKQPEKFIKLQEGARANPSAKGTEGAVAALLSLKVCDVACGSGHILLSAARRIALEVARKQFNEEQPSPAHLRWATRQVINHCIYGVDKNPLAVELCKVALWLEAHNPGEPLNFLDHRIKCGDAIVGLAHRNELENGVPDAAFKTLPADDKTLAAAFRKRNAQERKQKTQLGLFEAVLQNEVDAVIAKYNLFKNLPQNTPDEVTRKEREYHRYEQTVERIRLKQLADAQLAQFFIPKTDAGKAYLLTDAEYRSFLRNVNKGMGPLQSQKLAYAEALLPQHRFFHWFLEFPEVFAHEQGGFDCILGNPPFLGGQKLSGTFGDAYLECIKYLYAPIGAVDLVTYFFRRIFTLLKPGGFQALISTNTIAQGRAREDGLDVIIQQGGSINFAVKSTKWPGRAAVEVALVSITKQPWKGKFYLGNKEVKTITPYLDDAETTGNPYPLKQNEGKSFQGSIVLGKGFVLEPHEAEALIQKDPRNREVLFPYLNGDDLNNRPDQSPSRWVINFFDWPLEKAQTYPDCFEIVERLVKPERLVQNDKGGKEKWWQFLRPRNELYQTIAPLERVLVICRVTKYVKFSYTVSKYIFSDATNVLTYDSTVFFSLLESSIHEHWAWKASSTMGGTGLRYSPSDCFETFPFPKEISPLLHQKLEEIGQAYHEHRRQLMLGMQLGLTKTYNAFHCPHITSQNTKWATLLNALDTGKNLHDVAINAYGFDKESLNLVKHFQKGEPTISLRQAVEGIEHLRTLHVQMDEAVLEAYGWTDIALKHDFYEVDYLPENDRIRFTLHPDARKEVLKRLLQLNHQIHAEEIKAGISDKKAGKRKGKNG